MNKLEQVPEYLASHLAERIAEDPEIAELGIHVTVKPGWLLVSGAVATPERREAILRVIEAEAPDVDVRSDITVVEATAPGEEEVLS